MTEPVFDADLASVVCPVCGQPVVLAPPRPGTPACPICRIREASALEEAATPVGPWPSLALARGALPANVVAIALPPGERALDLGEGPIAWLVSDGAGSVELTALVGDLALDGVPLAAGHTEKLGPGARLSVPGPGGQGPSRELVRT